MTTHARQWALLASSIALSAALGEGLLQVGYRMANGEWLPAQNRGFQVGYTAPVDDRREFALRAGHHEAQVNDLGFRGAPVPTETPPPLVAVIGDSVPFGLYADASQSYPALLEGLCVSHKTDCRVLNAGVPAYNVRQSFDRYRIDVEPRYHPSVVVAQASNDISLLTQYREHWTPDVTWASVRLRESWGPSWTANVAAWHFLAPFLGGASQVAEVHFPYPAAAMLANIDRTIAEQAKIFAAQNIPLVLLPSDPFYYSVDPAGRNPRLRQWERWKNHTGVWRTTVDDVNRVLEEASRKYPGVRFFDIRQRMDTQDRDRMFLDYIHYSPEGARFVAGELYRFLVEEALLDGPQDDPESARMQLGLDDLYRRSDPASALRVFDRVLARTPTHYGASYQRAVALEKTGDVRRAHEAWRKVLDMATAIHDAAVIGTAQARVAALQGE